MKTETKNRIHALWGYPLTLILAPVIARIGNEKEKRRLRELSELLRDRIAGKRLNETPRL